MLAIWKAGSPVLGPCRHLRLGSPGLIPGCLSHPPMCVVACYEPTFGQAVLLLPVGMSLLVAPA
jgi:hypothetical protein